MGSIASKKSSSVSEKNVVDGLREKVKNIQGEMSEMVSERKKESAAYEKDMMVFAFKEAEWKQEKKKMREEVKMLRKMVEEKEEKIRGIVDAGVVLGGNGNSKGCGEKEWQALLVAEKMREGRARRDETVEKWKQLYLAIKVELDDLIQRTHCENGLYWRAEEEDIVEELKREVKAKEEKIAALKSRIVSMEKDQYKKEREIDILRQSLRIMSYKKEREIDILRQSLRIMSCKKTLLVTKNVSRDHSHLVKQARKL